MTGQTYSRKVDVDCLSTLASLGATVHKVNPLEAACFPTRLLPPSGEGWNCSTVDTTPSADPFVSLLPSTRSALISAYWPTWRSWKSLLRKSRSVNSTSSHYNALSYIHKQAFKQVFPPLQVPVPCLTRGTQCVRSGAAVWPAIWWHLWLTHCRRPQSSGWRGRWTTAPTGRTHNKINTFNTQFVWREQNSVKRGKIISRPTCPSLNVTEFGGSVQLILNLKEQT